MVCPQSFRIPWKVCYFGLKQYKPKVIAEAQISGRILFGKGAWLFLFDVFVAKRRVEALNLRKTSGFVTIGPGRVLPP